MKQQLLKKIFYLMVTGVVFVLAFGCTLPSDILETQEDVATDLSPGETTTRLSSSWDGYYYPANPEHVQQYGIPYRCKVADHTGIPGDQDLLYFEYYSLGTELYYPTGGNIFTPGVWYFDGCRPHSSGRCYYFYFYTYYPVTNIAIRSLKIKYYVYTPAGWKPYTFIYRK